MFQSVEYSDSLEKGYQLLHQQLHALLEGEKNQTANLANASALLHQFLPDVNWTGFYLYLPEEEELVLGPFQGLPACVRIPLNKGVCGTSAQYRETVRVADVTQFPGHIACDAASKSEIVIPLIKDEQLLGVLDIDSPLKDRFSKAEEKYLKAYVDILLHYL